MPPLGLLLDDPVPCEGFAGGASERAFLGVRVGAWNARVLAGLPTGAPGEHIVVEGGVVASARALAVVLAAGRVAGTDGRYVPDAEGCVAMAALSGGNPGVVYLAPGGSDRVSDRCGSAPRRPFAAEERTFDGFPLPDGPFRVADAWVFPVRHWAQVLWANLLALGPHLWGELVGHGAAAGARVVWATVRAGSTRPDALAAVLSRRGRGVRVHRSAVVEGAILGDGAVVGAGAVVRGSILGAGAVVEELALVEGAVLGAGARVQRMALAKFMVIEEGASHAGITQLSVIGRGAQVKLGATLMDLGLGQAVRVRAGGELRAAPHGMCGVGVGEDAVIGSGVRVAPGRAIPPGLTVLADSSGTLTRVDVPAGCTRAVVRDGALEPT